MKSFKHDMRFNNHMRFGGIIHPRIWAKAKRGERDALRWMIEDIEDLSMVGGFIGGVYRRAARRLRNIEMYGTKSAVMANVAKENGYQYIDMGLNHYEVEE